MAEADPSEEGAEAGEAETKAEAEPKPKLPPPDLPTPRRAAPLPAPNLGTPTLDELLEHSSRVQAARFGSGTLVAECLDTHHPHLPRRVFVRVRDEDGKAISAWLPTLAQLRPRVGQKLLVSKPDNWPEPVVMGVLEGLARPEQAEEEADAEAEAPSEAESKAAPGDPQLRLEQGQTVTVTGPEGQPLLSLKATPEGPQVTLMQSNVTVDMPGVLRIGADRIELEARAGGVDIRADGDTVVRSRTIRLN